jgi:hypothetical protein
MFSNYSGGLESRENRMTDQSLFQRREFKHGLSMQRRQIATDATKGLSAHQTAKTAGDLLLHLDHANIALSGVSE